MRPCMDFIPWAAIDTIIQKTRKNGLRQASCVTTMTYDSGE